MCTLHSTCLHVMTSQRLQTVMPRLRHRPVDTVTCSGNRFYCPHTVLCSCRNSGSITENKRLSLFPYCRISEWKCLIWLSRDCILSEWLTIRIVVWVIVLSFIKSQSMHCSSFEIGTEFLAISAIALNIPATFLLHIHMKYHSQHWRLLNKYSLALQNIEDALILQD